MIYPLKLRLRDAPIPRTCPWIGGGGETRTRGPVRDAGFQDRWFQPLTHPSDNVFNYLGYPPPFLFINSFINLRGPEGVGHVARLEINVSLVHLDAAVTAGLHRHFHGGLLASPMWATQCCGDRET